VNRQDIRQDERDSAAVDQWMKANGHDWNKDVWTWDRQHHAARREFSAFGADPEGYEDGDVDPSYKLTLETSLIADIAADEARELAQERGEPYGGV
jgi:hypothetical protein